MADPNELADYFHSLNDEELIRQCTTDLREDARALAEAEVRSRGLKLPESVEYAASDRESSASPSDYVDIAWLQDQAEAYLLKGYLEGFSIPSVVAGANVARAFGGAFGGTTLCVQKTFAKRAIEYVANYNNGDFQLDENASEGSGLQPNNSQPLRQAKGLKTYRVYSHPERAATMVVKVGFSWAALIFGPLWFLLNRMWINFLIFTSLVVGGNLYFRHFRPANQTELLLLVGMQILYIAAWFLFSKFANHLLCSDLENKGYSLKATVTAKNPAYARDEATRVSKNGGKA